MKRYCRGLAVLALLVGMGTEAFATANCFCKVALDIGEPPPSMNTMQYSYIDYGHIASYTNTQMLNIVSPPSVDCLNKCKAKAAGDANYNSPSFFCPKAPAAGPGSAFPNGMPLAAYSAVGTGSYRRALNGNTLINTPALTKSVCTCPKPWLNSSNVLGGQSGPDKNCKVQVATITPGPSGPPLGSAGYSGTITGNGGSTFWMWGNALWETASVAACVQTIISPAVCKWK